MTFARNAAVNGDWWLGGALDKPPLTIYAAAFSMTLVGVEPLPDGVLTLDMYQGEFAGRLPNLLAGVLLVAVLMRLTHAIAPPASRKTAPLIAGLLVGCSPYLIAFSPTAFTDMFMLLFSLIALWQMQKGRGAASGVFFALSFASKPQAVFFLLLLLAVGGATQRKAIRMFLITGVVGMGLLFLWDGLRPGESIFALGAANNTPGQWFAAINEIPARFAIWLHYSLWLFGGVWLVLAAALFIAVRKRVTIQWRVLGWFVGWIAGYALLHLITAVNTYDRYWLPLLPLLAILLARVLADVIHQAKPAIQRRAWAALVLLCIMTGLFASRADLPIGGDMRHHHGIDEAAQFLNAQPVATVGYDHWLGWHLGYYLGQWTDKRVVYYPAPAPLIEDALSLDEVGMRYFPVPDYADAERWLAAFDEAGFQPYVAFEAGRITIYGLIPPVAAEPDA